MWTQDDRDLALAWQSDQDERCPGCGEPRHEAWSSEAQDAYHDRVVAMRCHACKAKSAVQRRFATDESKSATDGLHVYVVPN